MSANALFYQIVFTLMFTTLYLLMCKTRLLIGVIYYASNGIEVEKQEIILNMHVM